MKYFFLLLICCLSLPAFAHQDFYVIRNYGNIQTTIKTGFLYEEINKALIIGQIAEKLSNELNHKDTILLHFNHHYTITEEVKPDYFVAYNNDKNRIEINIHGNKFEIISILKLLEYAIKNTSTIQNQQKITHYEKHYNNIDFITISEKSIREILNQPNSILIVQIIDNKIYRPDGIAKDQNTYGITYYWRNNKFHLIEKTYDEEIPIIQLDNIYTFDNLDLNTVVFDTHQSFYHICSIFWKQPKLSRKLLIENEHIHDYFRPCYIADIGGNRTSIYFFYYTENFETKDVNLIYYPEKELLIQDMDEIISKYIEKTK